MGVRRGDDGICGATHRKSRNDSGSVYTDRQETLFDHPAAALEDAYFRRAGEGPLGRADGDEVKD